MSTRLLADELSCDYSTLLVWRHRLQAHALVALPTAPLTDTAVETYAMFHNAGEKGALHAVVSDSAGRHTNKREGRSTMRNDRAAVLGVVGCTTGQIRLVVVEDTQQTTVQALVLAATRSDATLYSDEAVSFAGSTSIIWGSTSRYSSGCTI